MCERIRFSKRLRLQFFCESAVPFSKPLKTFAVPRFPTVPKSSAFYFKFHNSRAILSIKSPEFVYPREIASQSKISEVSENSHFSPSLFQSLVFVPWAAFTVLRPLIKVLSGCTSKFDHTSSQWGFYFSLTAFNWTAHLWENSETDLGGRSE